MTTVDNDSPPGSWANEMKAAPWAFGQSKNKTVEQALAAVRAANLWEESILLAQEITLLKAEIERLNKEVHK